MSPHIRRVVTASGATAVQVVFAHRDGSRELKHIGSAHSEAALAALEAAAKSVMNQGQLELDFGLSPAGPPVPPPGVSAVSVPVVRTKAWRDDVLLACIDACYQRLGFDTIAGADRVFRDLVRARIIQPASKQESLEILARCGVDVMSYRTLLRRLPRYATSEFQASMTRRLASFARVGAGSFILYDVTTLYFETDTPDELRKPGYSKERRVEPQILVGLLTDHTGFPLVVGAFEGNMAETHTMLPVLTAFTKAYQLSSVTVVADAGMFSAANKQAIIDAGFDYILSTKITKLPPIIEQWCRAHEHQLYPDQMIWSQPCAPDRRRKHTQCAITHYHYSEKRAKRTRKGIQEQVVKAEQAVAGRTAIKRNKYVDLHRPEKTVNYALANKHQQLAGLKGYETTLTNLPASEVIAHYKRLLKIERSFRMSKSDLKARPIYAHKHESINAHITIVIAALAISHLLEQHFQMSIKKVVTTLKTYRTAIITINNHIIEAPPEIPPKLQTLIDTLTQPPVH